MLELERELVARCAPRLVRDGLVVGTAGNISVRSATLIAITPAATDYGRLTAADVVVVDADGTIVDGDLPPSSELPMHLAVYAATDAGAVVHTHSPFATALATAGLELPPIHYLAGGLGGRVRLAPYATFGTPLLAASVVTALRGRTAVLLEQHGALTVGGTLEQAYGRALDLEWLAALYVRARALAPLRELTPEELDAVAGRLERRAAGVR